MSGRRYRASVGNVSVSAAQDLFEITAPADACVVIHGWEIAQTSDAKEAEEELLRIETVRGSPGSTGGSGGTTPTAQPIQDGDQAFGGTVEANNTTRMSGQPSDIERLAGQAWNIRVPKRCVYAPERRPIISPGHRWTLSLPSAPADAITLSASVTFAELGG